MLIEFEKLQIDLSLDKVLKQYPVDKLPTRLKRRTGKASKTGFETIDVNLYDPAAKMVAFHTHADRIIPWIKALDILYYDNFGQMDSMIVRWVDVPDQWTDASSIANSIVIELCSADKELANTLWYKLTFFISTGTVQVQGNEKDQFTNEHFAVLKRLVSMVVDKVPQSVRARSIYKQASKDLESELSDLEPLDGSSPKDCDDEITYVKTLYSKGTSRQRSGKGATRKRFPLQKPRWEKTKLTIRYLYHETIVSRMGSYFPNRWPLSYLNLTKNMKTHIRRQQHKKSSNTKT